MAGASAVPDRAVVRHRVDEHRVVEQLHADAGGLPPALANLWLPAPRECHLLAAHAAEGGADVDPRRARTLHRRGFGCGAAAPAAAALEGARARVLTRAVGGGWHQRGDRRRRFHGSRGAALFLLCDGGPTLPHPSTSYPYPHPPLRPLPAVIPRHEPNTRTRPRAARPLLLGVTPPRLPWRHRSPASEPPPERPRP